GSKRGTYLGSGGLRSAPTTGYPLRPLTGSTEQDPEEGSRFHLAKSSSPCVFRRSSRSLREFPTASASAAKASSRANPSSTSFTEILDLRSAKGVGSPRSLTASEAFDSVFMARSVVSPTLSAAAGISNSLRWPPPAETTTRSGSGWEYEKTKSPLTSSLP